MSDLLEAVRPIVAAPGGDLRRLVGQMDLNTVAVELDVEDARAGSMKAGKGALTPIAAGLLR